MIIATVALLRSDSKPDETAIRTALRHHLCRCGTHLEILAAVREAALGMANAAPPNIEERAS
jgi:nicotinate dehydrogenase subunit A